MRIFEHIALCCVGQKGIVPFLFLTKHPSKDVVSQLRKVVWVRFRGFLPCSWDGREGETLSSAPILGELLCSPGYPWRAAEVNCAAIVGMQDQGGKPHSLAGLVYSRTALEKPAQCYTCNVVAKLLKLPFITLLLGVAL